jgi:hypothetical protein
VEEKSGNSRVYLTPLTPDEEHLIRDYLGRNASTSLESLSRFMGTNKRTLQKRALLSGFNLRSRVCLDALDTKERS